MKKNPNKIKRTANHIIFSTHPLKIKPYLKYTSEVWRVCSLADSKKLEQVQISAARIY